MMLVEDVGRFTARFCPGPAECFLFGSISGTGDTGPSVVTARRVASYNPFQEVEIVFCIFYVIYRKLLVFKRILD